MDPVSIIVATIGGVAGLASAVYTARAASRASQKKTEADERAALRQIEADAYERARESYEGILAQLRTEVDRQARQINGLQRQIARLSRQVRDAGLVPVTSSEEEA
jgi:vacuolar-type H+-ATPase subunit H